MAHISVEDVLEHLKELIAIGEYNWNQHTYSAGTVASIHELYAGARSVIRQVFPPRHAYVEAIEKLDLDDDFERMVAQVPVITGLLRAARKDVERGWMTEAARLIAADVFSDFLEMAQHLLDEGYKDAAAVIAGSSLEAHLKRLCAVANISLTATNGRGETVAKKADTLNSELAAAGVYDKNEQKQVTAWLGIRNEAAHGNYANVRADMVGLMIPGIRQFTTRYPA